MIWIAGVIVVLLLAIGIIGIVYQLRPDAGRKRETYFNSDDETTL